MRCEESFIIIKLIWHDYLVFSLNIYVHKTPTDAVVLPSRQGAAHPSSSQLALDLLTVQEARASIFQDRLRLVCEKV